MTIGESRVDEWLQNGDDAESVVSGYGRGVASECGDFDEAKYVLSPEPEVVETGDLDAAADVEAALAVVAEGAQRKAVCAMHRLYSRGRMYDTPDYEVRSLQPQLFFKLDPFVELASLDDPVLVDMLMKETVRTRVGAATGMGKTMKLPGLLASKCGLRVCQLELDNDVASMALKFQKKAYGIPGSARAWCREKKAYLTCMSYADFRGVVLSGDRNRLFADFDVFYMDEAHEPQAAVWAARQYFAAFSQPHNSLLVVSATVSTVEANNAVARGVGKFDEEQAPVSLDEAMSSGELTGSRLHDRTQVLVATDEDVAVMRSYYIDCGLDVVVLDSASTIADREAVVNKLLPTTSVVPRILVSTENYGTSYNFPVSYVISTCTRRVYEFDAENALVEKEIPNMRKTRVQHQGRVGRGLATGAGGWLMSPEVSVDRELLVGEALEAYLSLVAASIRPRPGLFDSVARVLPKGVDAAVARMLLRSSLPVGLAMRYLGTDGRFAARFVGAVQLFHQTGERLRKSKDEYPVGYESWVVESVGHYYEGDETVTATELSVPFKSPKGLKIPMHAISAVAAGHLSLEYWDWFDEEEESDDEEVGVRTRAKRRVVPRMPEAPPPKAAASVSTEAPVWQYDADPSAARVKQKRRQGMSWTANGEGKLAVTTLLRAIEKAELGKSVAVPEIGVPEYDGKVAYALPLEDEGMVPVKSAGGGRIMLVSMRVHEAFMSGDELQPQSAADVLAHLSEMRALERFAKSTLFDNWSPAWLCWFKSYAVSGVFAEFKRRGMHSDAVRLLDFLYDRFRSEMVSVIMTSNYYRDKLGGFFNKTPSVTKLAIAAEKGKLPIAQSDAFLMQFLRIKNMYDKSVLAIETSGVFAPKLVAKAQERLPIHQRHRKMAVIDEDVVAREGSTQLRVDSSRKKWRR